MMHEPETIKQAVRDRYAGHATQGTSCCGGGSSCCGDAPSATESLGYSPDDVAAIPEGADLGLGCGNPLGMLELSEGETVLDLGSGAGIDCFLAAKRVGPTGRVIGVDMTPEMVARARANAASVGADHVEFRLGELEALPVSDGSIDAIISNCVVNLVPDKARVFAEAFRVLKPGGRISISDIVLLAEVPARIRDSVEAYVACLSGAILRDEYLRLIEEAGFTDVTVTEARGFDIEDAIGRDVVDEYVKHAEATEQEVRAAASAFQSIRVRAVRPATAR